MGPAATSASQFQASSNASSYHGPTRLCGGSLVCTGALSPTHIGPMPRTRARWSACGQRRPGTYLTVYVRNKELTRIFRSPHACNTPRQTPNPPKRRPIQPKQPVFSVFAQWVCTLAATSPQAAAAPPPSGGNCTTRGSDTPTTRHQGASCRAKPPLRHSKQAAGLAHTTKLDRKQQSG